MKTISIYDSLLVLGRGIGQVMFQNNALSGLLMLVGIFLNSWQLGVLAVGGNIISTLAACISGYGRDDIKNGLYGFNGTLIGIAVGVFMQLSLWSLLLMAVASCFSTWIVRLFSRQHSLPGFTAPFIFSVWILLGICTWITPDLLLVSETVSDTVREVDYVQAFCLGIGFMFSLAVRCIAVCRDQVGNYYSDCTFCTICMDDNDNAESGEYKR